MGGCSIVARQAYTLQSVPPAISSSHLAPDSVITILLTMFPSMLKERVLGQNRGSQLYPAGGRHAPPPLARAGGKQTGSRQKERIADPGVTGVTAEGQTRLWVQPESPEMLMGNRTSWVPSLSRALRRQNAVSVRCCHRSPPQRDPLVPLLGP